MFWLKITYWYPLSNKVLLCAVSHCAFSSNLFHGQIVQIAILQLSGPENKKCSPWKVFGKNHPQILLLLSRRGPRSPDTRLSQHYIGPKMTFQHFSNFCRKKSFQAWQEGSCTILYNFRGCNLQKSCGKTSTFIQSGQEIRFIKPGNFFCRNLKNVGMSFLGWCNVETVSLRGF